jgi:Fe-S-cluster containining protein
MNPCENCPIEDKIYECCGRFPDSGAVGFLQIDESTWLHACPYLDRCGRCSIYENRPLGCRTHYCTHYTFREFNREYMEILSYLGSFKEEE